MHYALWLMDIEGSYGHIHGGDVLSGPKWNFVIKDSPSYHSLYLQFEE